MIVFILWSMMRLSTISADICYNSGIFNQSKRTVFEIKALLFPRGLRMRAKASVTLQPSRAKEEKRRALPGAKTLRQKTPLAGHPARMDRGQ